MTEYLERVNKHIIDASNKARKQRDGKAWDNAKRKARKRYVPRGKVFMKLTREEHQRWWKEITGDLPQDMVDMIQRKDLEDSDWDGIDNVPEKFNPTTVEENHDDGIDVDEESHYN